MAALCRARLVWLVSDAGEIRVCSLDDYMWMPPEEADAYSAYLEREIAFAAAERRRRAS
jgi:hypothetical protein